MTGMEGGDRHRTLYLKAGLVIAFLILAGQLFRLQLLDNSFKVSARNNALYYQTRYPARGLILDRNGKVLVGNKNSYDILVTPRYIKELDTAALCSVLNIKPEYVRAKFQEYRMYRSRIGFRAVTFLSQVSPEQYSRFIEVRHKFPEFFGIPRTTRMYPYNAGGNLLGYVTEVDRDFLEKHPDYESGDYVGRTGLEQTCEYMLRGRKGYSIYLRDASNRIQSSYRDGEMDKPAAAGQDVVSTIDAELQNYGEELMRDKVGSVIAIEPSTGEILSMVSSTRHRCLHPGRDQQALQRDSLRPLHTDVQPGRHVPPASRLGVQARKRPYRTTGRCRKHPYRISVPHGLHRPGHPRGLSRPQVARGLHGSHHGLVQLLFLLSFKKHP